MSTLRMNGDESEWTREELTVYTEPITALAKAVIKQWVLDGKPAAGKAAIDEWFKVLNEVNQLKEKGGN